MRQGHADYADDGWVDTIIDGEGAERFRAHPKKLPPLPPLTEEEKNDRLLTPLEIEPPVLWQTDGFEAVTDGGESFDHHSIHGVVRWLMDDGRLKGVDRVVILRHRKGQPK